MAIIDVHDLGKSYRLSGRGRVWVVEQVHLRVTEGTILGLLGPNGAGKTTLIKMLAGLLRPDRGGGTVLGYDLLRQHARIRGLVSLVAPTADVGIDNNLTVRQNLAFWAPIFGLYGRRARSRIDGLLERLNLADKADFWPMHISAGQRQRLALARSLLAETPLLFLDEPTNELDSEGVRSVRQMIADLNQQHAVTILLTTHVMEEAEELCGEIALLREGALMAHQPTAELMRSLRLTRPITATLKRESSEGKTAVLSPPMLPATTAVQISAASSTSLTVTAESLDLRATTPALLAWVREQGCTLTAMRGTGDPHRCVSGAGRGSFAGRTKGETREMMWVHEQQRGGLVGFVRACGGAAWLEYRNLRYYPSNLILAAIQELTAVGVWYFVGRFLDAGASQAVQQYGANYLAYVVIGVLLNQVCLAALNGPFTTISEAFWDKRLETYRLSVHGIWANIVGRLGWQVCFSTCLQLLALLLLLLPGGIALRASISWPLVVCAFLLLVLSNAGLGVAGASLFFLLEVKSGQDPITWAYRYLVMLASGLYVPLLVLPGWLRSVSSLLPQTYGLAAVRLLLLTGASWNSPTVWANLIPLTVAALLTLGTGYGLLTMALRRAERGGGIGVVV